MKTYTIEQVAEVLQVSKRTVKRYLASGQLKKVRINQQTVRIDETDLKDFLERHKG